MRKEDRSLEEAVKNRESTIPPPAQWCEDEIKLELQYFGLLM